MDHDNPFHQPSELWCLTFTLRYEAAPFFEELFAEDVLCVSMVEVKGSNETVEPMPGDEWSLQFYFETPPTEAAIRSALTEQAALANIAVPEFTLAKIANEDWVAKVQAQYPPFAVGNFYIHNSSYEPAGAPGSISLCIDAARAFGTGEHETTASCLLLLEKLKERHHFHSMADIGCGSGILAIAMAKLWQQPVLASDIEPLSVEITAANSVVNQVQDWVTTVVAAGCDHEEYALRKPFDLIVANILAEPLKTLAPVIARHSNVGGHVLLSGLLISQEEAVIEAYNRAGFTLELSHHTNQWSALQFIRCA